jgi:hypothetical protein
MPLTMKTRIRMQRMCATAIMLSAVSMSTYAGELIISPLKAVPRWGNTACWIDTGGRIKNNCSTTQLLSFIPEQVLMGKTVTSIVSTDAPFAKLKCQHVSLGETLTNYWANSFWQSNAVANSGVSIAYLTPWWVPHLVYQIDCQVPPGVQIMSAHVLW